MTAAIFFDLDGDRFRIEVRRYSQREGWGWEDGGARDATKPDLLLAGYMPIPTVSALREIIHAHMGGESPAPENCTGCGDLARSILEGLGVL